MSDRCTVQAGPDRCELRAGHPGEHHTMWGSVRMSWQGGEEWSHDWAAFAAGTGEVASGRDEIASGHGELVFETQALTEAHSVATMNDDGTK